MKNKLLKFFPIIILSVFLPFIAFAANTDCSTVTGLGNLVCNFNKLLNSVIPVILTLGMVYFVWGVVQYVISDDEQAKSKGRDRIIFGIIGLVVIVGVWGLVNMIVTTFNLGGQSAPDVTNLVTTPVTGSTCVPMGENSSFADTLNYFTCIIGSSVIPFMFALAMASFIWGAIKFFIIDSDDETKREQGKQFMLWGVIALAVMISVWGLVNILTSTFGFKGTEFLPSVKP